MLIILIGGSCGSTDVLHLWIIVNCWWSWLIDHTGVLMTFAGGSGGSASEWLSVVDQVAVLREKKGGRPKEKIVAVPCVLGMYIVCTCMPGELPYTTQVSVWDLLSANELCCLLIERTNTLDCIWWLTEVEEPWLTFGDFYCVTYAKSHPTQSKLWVVTYRGGRKTTSPVVEVHKKRQC